MENNEVVNNIIEETIETTQDLVTDACENRSTLMATLAALGKGVGIGVGIFSIGYGGYRLGKKLWNKHLEKKGILPEPEYTVGSAEESDNDTEN